VVIGDQVWMTENLKVTHYRDGTAIPNLTSKEDRTRTNRGAYIFYDNNSSNGDTYGALYNWYAVAYRRNIAPAGWHVPTDAEWKELEQTLGMSQSEADDTGWRGANEGSKLAGDAGLWNSGSLENNSGFGTRSFTTLPSGYRHYSNGSYTNMGSNGYFWSATELHSSTAWYRELSYYSSDVARDLYNKKNGFSVRCVKDQN